MAFVVPNWRTMRKSIKLGYFCYKDFQMYQQTAYCCLSGTNNIRIPKQKNVTVQASYFSELLGI